MVVNANLSLGRERAAAFLKHKLRQAEMTYSDLAKKLKKHGFRDRSSITNKLGPPRLQKKPATPCRLLCMGLFSTF